DGIAVCGQRLADSIRALVAASPVPFERLSLVGYSAGGLFVRYAAGVLHGDGFFAAAGLEPTLLVTIATPHLGSRWHGDTPVGELVVGVYGLVHGPADWVCWWIGERKRREMAGAGATCQGLNLDWKDKALVGHEAPSRRGDIHSWMHLHRDEAKPN
ncbi:unnamed protein product, partial [Phaeothamnion confervicola]